MPTGKKWCGAIEEQVTVRLAASSHIEEVLVAASVLSVPEVERVLLSSPDRGQR